MRLKTMYTAPQESIRYNQSIMAAFRSIETAAFDTHVAGGGLPRTHARFSPRARHANPHQT
jgi:hypothetical protein